MSTPDPSLLSSSCSPELHWVLDTHFRLFWTFQHRLICVTHPTKMRRYDIVSGILLILSIIDFALAAPVLVQERRQAGIDMAHIPRNVITVLGKRGDDELEKLAEDYFKTGGKPVDSSGAHAPSSSAPSDSAPPGPDHGSTNVVQSPAPNPASSTANPDPLIEGPSSTAALQGSWEYHFNAAWDDVFSNKGDDEFSFWPQHNPSLTEHGSDHELTGAHAPQPNPNPKKRPLTDPDPDFDGTYWWKASKGDPARLRPAPPKEFGQAHEYQPEVEHVQQPSPGTSSEEDWSSEDELSSEEEWAALNALDKLIPPRPASPKEFSQAHEYQVEHVQQPNPGPSADPDFNWHHWANLEDAPPSRPSSSKLSIPESSNPGPSNLESSNPRPSNPVPSNLESSNPEPSNLGPSNPGTSNPSLPTEPELRPDDQSLSADSQMDDVPAAIYGAKGKGKQLRRISGTARDVGNAAQRELQLAC
ncbi:hypothetical protein F5888DRAFT_1800388 [Russula emetica]|nr:hypothetical protein F5888DRAFT_1800388 [Russula emetica]